MELEKTNPFCNDVVFIDGLWGTGKSLLSPIISGMDRVEKVKIEHLYEYICILHHLDKMSSDAAIWMLKTYADLSQYNNLIGREVNLRWRDDSGFANNPNSLRYIKRLFGGEGDQKVADINDNNRALNIVSHMLMLVADKIFETYGCRAKIIEVVRHPLYMVNHWSSYLQRYDSSREFTPSFYHKEEKIPWFIDGWEDEFVEANEMDKVLLSIIKLFEWADMSAKNMLAKGGSVLILSFESLVLTPSEPLQQLEDFLKRKHGSRLKAIMKKQKMGRKTISAGKGRAAYGWSKKTHLNEKQVYLQYLENIKTNGSEENVDKFLRLIELYNEKYPSVLSQYQ
jgi:hypothetical protein